MVKTILVVAAPSSERDALVVCLEAAGYTLMVASTRAEALDILRGLVPGAVYVDLAMPQREGRLVVEDLAVHPRLRMVPRLVSLGAWRRNTRPVSASAAFVKPVDPDHVARTLRAVYPPPAPAATPVETRRLPAAWEQGLEASLAS
jgi:two-component system chemotaxis response regulator CheY